MPISLDDLSYPFDPTGTLASNLVPNEQAVITAVNYKDYHFIVPRWAPYFLDSMVITLRQTDGTIKNLVMGVDWYGCFEFISASRACAAPIWGGVSLLDTQLSGIVSMTYQTLGGIWTQDEATISQLLAYDLHDPRVTAWEEVVNIPIMFPPIDHEWDLVDLVGASDLVTALQGIEAAIRASGGADFEAHIMNFNNPHQTTASQVTLGNVPNYAAAGSADWASGTANNLLMTPAGVTAMLGNSGTNPGAGLAAHEADHNNPHEVDAAQVNAYDIPTMDGKLAQKLGPNDTAADSVLFNGMDENAYAEFVLNQTASNSVLFDGLNQDQYAAIVLQGTAANSTMLGGQTAAQLLGDITQQTSRIFTQGEAAGSYWEELAHCPLPTDANLWEWSDTNFLVSGGGSNGGLVDGLFLISVSVRGPTGSPVEMTVSNLGVSTPANCTFGYSIDTVDDGTGTGHNITAARIWMETTADRDPVTLTLLSQFSGTLLSDSLANRVNAAPTGWTPITTAGGGGVATQDDLITVVNAITTVFTSLNTTAVAGE